VKHDRVRLRQYAAVIENGDRRLPGRIDGEEIRLARLTGEGVDLNPFVRWSPAKTILELRSIGIHDAGSNAWAASSIKAVLNFLPRITGCDDPTSVVQIASVRCNRSFMI
jgi:hypothetical protein